MKKIAIGTDHRGFSHKEYLIKNCGDIQWIDVGAFDTERSDYPIFARRAVNLVLTHSVSAAVLLCGSGSGMAIAANRFTGIYAAVAWSPQVACAAKEDDAVNVLVIPADYVSQEEAQCIVVAWHKTPFKGGRYADRISMID